MTRIVHIRKVLFFKFWTVQVLFVGPLIPVLDFWWHLPWVSKPGWISCLLRYLFEMDSSVSPLTQHLPRFFYGRQVSWSLYPLTVCQARVGSHTWVVGLPPLCQPRLVFSLTTPPRGHALQMVLTQHGNSSTLQQMSHSSPADVFP